MVGRSVRGVKGSQMMCVNHPDVPHKCKGLCNACYQRSQSTLGGTRKSNLKFFYSLTVEEFEAIYSYQNGACAACRSPFTEAKMEKPHVDHDHSCCAGLRSCGNCVRGLLCGRCNMVAGWSKDSPDLVQDVADYLRRTRS